MITERKSNRNNSQIPSKIVPHKSVAYFTEKLLLMRSPKSGLLCNMKDSSGSLKIFEFYYDAKHYSKSAIMYIRRIVWSLLKLLCNLYLRYG